MAEIIPVPTTAPHPSRRYFQELFFGMDLIRNLMLPGPSVERKFYIVEGFILVRPGPSPHCPGVMLFCVRAALGL